MKNQLTKPQILTDEQIVKHFGEEFDEMGATSQEKTSVVDWWKPLLNTQRDDTLKKIVEWMAKVNKIAWYTERYPEDYGCNIGPEDWQALNQLAGGK